MIFGGGQAAEDQKAKIRDKLAPLSSSLLSHSISIARPCVVFATTALKGECFLNCPSCPKAQNKPRGSTPSSTLTQIETSSGA